VGRSIEKALKAKQEVLAVLPSQDSDAGGRRTIDDDRVIALECDHCSLVSVRRFCEELRHIVTNAERGLRGVDVLCLNAAVLFPDGDPPQFTQDGHEATFQTNHLAPFLIANTLLKEDMINPGGRIIFTTSGLHVGKQLKLDGALDPLTGDARKGFEMLDGTKYHFKRCYVLSKLCNVAVCAELNERMRRLGNSMTVNCFSPGLMRSTKLFRRQHQDPTGLIPDDCRERVLRQAKTVEWGAGSLVFMMIADETGRRGGEYWSDTTLAGNAAVYGEHFVPSAIDSSPSDVKTRLTLWKISCRLSSIPYDI